MVRHTYARIAISDAPCSCLWFPNYGGAHLHVEYQNDDCRFRSSDLVPKALA